MSTTYHTSYEDDVTQFKAAHMNVPLGELDAQIGTNVTNIATNTSDLKKTVHVLDTAVVDFSVTGNTLLHTTLSGETTVPVMAVIRAGGDAGATEVTIGKSGELTSFLGAQTLSNLDASGETVILQPVPNATPAVLKTYTGDTQIRIDVTTADGAATNWVDLLGYTI